MSFINNIKGISLAVFSFFIPLKSGLDVFSVFMAFVGIYIKYRDHS